MDIIMCTDINFGYTKNNSIPWRLERDSNYFKTMIYDSNLIIGRKTYEDMGKPKLDIYNIIIISNTWKECSDINYHVINSPEKYKKFIDNNRHTFVLGGYNIWKYFMENEKIDNIYHTKILENYKCEKSCMDIINYYEIYYRYKCTQRKIKDYDIRTRERKNTILFHYTSIGRKDMEYQYLNILNVLMNKNKFRETRNQKTISKFSTIMKYDLEFGFPLLTTKKMFFRGIVEELLFFIRGDTDVSLLNNKGVKFWNANTTEEFIKKTGLKLKKFDMGPMYGFQWRHYGASYKGKDEEYKGQGFDQLSKVIKEIKNNSSSRRIVITTFNPAAADKGVLYPCHSLMVQFYINDNKLSMTCYNRSSDVLLGLPFNIASSALLLTLIAKVTNNKPGELSIHLGDYHIYKSHVDAVKKQLERNPHKFCKLEIMKEKKNQSDIEYLETLEYKDFKLINYKSHGRIKAKMVA